MYYNKKEMSLPEYFMVRVSEMGFSTEGPDNESHDGYYRSEAEYNAIAEYESSCGLTTKEEKEFAAMHGFESEMEKE